MVSIAKRRVGGEEYYYVEQSIREGEKVRKKQQYLGKALPRNIEEIKKMFAEEIYRERWFKVFEEIKKRHAAEQKEGPASVAEKVVEGFATKFTYDTNRIEGSTLTYKETADLLERGITPGARPSRDVKEAEAHKTVFYEMLKDEKRPTMQKVLSWHNTLLGQTKPDIAGKIRTHGVAISGSRFVPPTPVEVYPMLRALFSWGEREEKRMQPVELAARTHLKFVTIHPFADGNGRISRLMANHVLHRHGYPMLNIEYKDRRSYYNALERAQVKGMEDIFVQWFFRRYKKEHGRDK